MSSDRWVCLSEEEIRALQGKAGSWYVLKSAKAKLRAALDHPGGVNDGMVERGAASLYGVTMCQAKAGEAPWDGLDDELRAAWRSEAREVLEAALGGDQ
jgi:hypothetical protein